MRIAGQVSLDDLPHICPLLHRKANSQYGDGQTRVVEVRGVRFGGDRPLRIVKFARGRPERLEEELRAA